MKRALKFIGLDPHCPPEILALQRHIQPTFLDFNECSKKGSLLIHHSIAEETEQIFEQIFNLKFPISCMNNLDEYLDPTTGRWCDSLSMQANNCSAFHFRRMSTKFKLSYHALGLAIDINPLLNPLVINNQMIPKDAVYNVGQPGVFSRDHPVVKLFESYGWVWGGNFNELKDYHHFQKYHPDLDIWQDKLRELYEEE